MLTSTDGATVGTGVTGGSVRVGTGVRLGVASVGVGVAVRGAVVGEAEFDALGEGDGEGLADGAATC